MKTVEFLNETLSQKSEQFGIEIILSNVITNGIDTATENYCYQKKDGKHKFIYEKIAVREFGFTSTCYVSETKIENFLLLTADPHKIYFDVTGTKYAEGVKKYLDYLWEIKWDENDPDLSDDLFDTTNDPDIPAVKYPNITSYFEKELVNSYVDGHDKFLQADDRLYVNIGGGSNSCEPEWYKEVLESIGINDVKYVIYNKKYRF